MKEKPPLKILFCANSRAVLGHLGTSLLNVRYSMSPYPINSFGCFIAEAAAIQIATHKKRTKSALFPYMDFINCKQKTAGFKMS